MWALLTNKRRLLDLFGEDGLEIVDEASQMNSSFIDQVLKENLLLLWTHKPAKNDLPVTIIVADAFLREFMAWATTVIGGYRPFTAFFKVLNKSLFDKVVKFKEPTLGNLDNSLVGLIIGESITQYPNIRPIHSLSLLPCKSTYSFSLARAYALGYDILGGFSEIARAWTLARQLTRQPARKLLDETIQLAFRVIMDLHTNRPNAKPNAPEFIIQTCRELFFHGSAKNSFNLLAGQNPTLDQIFNDLEGPREIQVQNFEKIMQSPIGFDPIISSFLVGFLASQIGKGTFEHIDLLTSHIPEYEMALLWYGVCAGLHKNSEVQEFASCLGRRLTRDLLAIDPLASQPKYDISIGELEVYLGREVPLEFRVASHSHIAVEIMPGVPAFMRWPINDSTPAEKQESSSGQSTYFQTGDDAQTNLFPDRFEDDPFKRGETALNDLNEVLGRLKEVFKDIGRQPQEKIKKSKGKSKKRKTRT